MASIKLRRGSGVPSGLTFGEPAFDITNSRLYIGITGSSVLVGVAGGGVHSFNGLTGAVTGVTTGTANTFGPLQSFTSGISSSGGTFSSQVNFVSGISASGGTFGGLVRFTGGLSASGATFGPNVNIGNTAATTNLFLRGSINFINCPNGFLTITTGQTASGLNIEDASGNNTSITPTTHEIEFYDQSDGDTVTLNAGLVVGAGSYTVALPSYGTTLAGLAGQQTFTGLKSFSAGISASGGVTFNSTIISNGYRYSSSVFNSITSGFTLSAADAGKIFLIGFCGGSTNIYCPTGLPVGFQCDVIRRQAASQRIRIFQSGTTIESKSGNNPELTNSSNGGEKATIIQIDTNVYVVYGDI